MQRRVRIENPDGNVHSTSVVDVETGEDLTLTVGVKRVVIDADDGRVTAELTVLNCGLGVTADATIVEPTAPAPRSGRREFVENAAMIVLAVVAFLVGYLLGRGVDHFVR